MFGKVNLIDLFSTLNTSKKYYYGEDKARKLLHDFVYISEVFREIWSAAHTKCVVISHPNWDCFTVRFYTTSKIF